MLQKLNHAQRVTPAELNKVIEAVNRGIDISATAPLELTRNSGRVQLRVTEKGFMAYVTARTPSNRACSATSAPSVPGRSSSSGECSAVYFYTLKEVGPHGNGCWVEKEGGREVIATEWNDSKVAVNTVVWVEPFGNEDWRFEHCCGLDDTCNSSSSSSQSSQSQSSQSQSSQSDSSQSQSSDSCPAGCCGTLIEFITGLSYNEATCTLTVTKSTLCLPSCINVSFTSSGTGSGGSV